MAIEHGRFLGQGAYGAYYYFCTQCSRRWLVGTEAPYQCKTGLCTPSPLGPSSPLGMFKPSGAGEVRRAQVDIVGQGNEVPPPEVSVQDLRAWMQNTTCQESRDRLTKGIQVRGRYRMLNEIRDLNTTQKNEEQLIAMSAFGTILETEYEKQGIPQPEWLVSNLRSLRTEITLRSRDAMEKRLLEAQVRLEALTPAEEKRTRLSEEIAALRSKLGRA